MYCCLESVLVYADSVGIDHEMIYHSEIMCLYVLVLSQCFSFICLISFLLEAYELLKRENTLDIISVYYLLEQLMGKTTK